MSTPPPGLKSAEPPPRSSPAPLSHEDAQAHSQSRQVHDNGRYEFKSVHAVRGREGSAKAKWQNQGWELVSENAGKLRTELNFRRVKPKTLGDYLQDLVAALGRMQPKTRFVLVASCAMLAVAGIIGIVSGAQGGGDTPNASAAQASSANATPSADPTATPAQATPTAEPAASTAEATPTADPTVATPAVDEPADKPKAPRTLSAANSKEFAALLAVPDYCDDAIAPFAAKYGGRTIEFDGSLSDLAHHGDYDTRFDILVAPGNNGPSSAIGPAFKFENVNIYDLHLTGDDDLDAVGEGDRFRFVAQIEKYDPNSCLFFLTPVSTGIR
jgi:hypothetical protein